MKLPRFRLPFGRNRLSAEEIQLAGNTVEMPHAAPPRLQKGDGLVLSFPRSGNTWLCVQMAHALEKQLILDGLRPLPGWQVADLHRHPEHPLLNEPHSAVHPRIFRSHNHLFDPRLRVVYLVRRPEDALVSYFRLVHGETEEKPDAWVLRKLPIWIAHVKAALSEHASRPESILLLTYETMKRSPGVILQSVFSFFGLHLSSEARTYAGRQSELHRMKKEEAARNRPKTTSMQGELFRSGSVGSGTQELHPTTLERMHQQASLLYQRAALQAGSGRLTKSTH